MMFSRYCYWEEGLLSEGSVMWFFKKRVDPWDEKREYDKQRNGWFAFASRQGWYYDEYFHVEMELRWLENYYRRVHEYLVNQKWPMAHEQELANDIARSREVAKIVRKCREEVEEYLKEDYRYMR